MGAIALQQSRACGTNGPNKKQKTITYEGAPKKTKKKKLSPIVKVFWGGEGFFFNWKNFKFILKKRGGGGGQKTPANKNRLIA